MKFLQYCFGSAIKRQTIELCRFSRVGDVKYGRLDQQYCIVGLQQMKQQSGHMRDSPRLATDTLSAERFRKVQSLLVLDEQLGKMERCMHQIYVPGLLVGG